MEVLEAIQARRSIRKFKSEALSDDLIRELLEAGRLAPSGMNIQPWRFVVVKSPEAREKLRSATPLAFVAQAPVVLAVCVDKQSFSQVGDRARELQEAGSLGKSFNAEEYAQRRNRDPQAALSYLVLNAAITIDHITLRAVDLGLGSCWVMMFDQELAKLALGLEDQYHIVALLPVGYPDQSPGLRPRLPLEKLVLKEV
ncbi:nitroreductase family protein [Desulforamulus ruminis]|uniref:Nitroreductase n=1 Tax=Desulforamulus ruminis (strain ATCC 23193 / DSM 2154 / NCIMB 8452 / DL) TaxID=696281 RepID=F6DV72_DESRL|nr:nitroreductase family protein [Desulforamulus ruminis]AEG59138.1 nitroreductase [Desulforamulus ruminis DSM 2154]